jgi:hypothetical protein
MVYFNSVEKPAISELGSMFETLKSQFISTAVNEVLDPIS